MRIGHLELTNNLILAPMAGVTDRPFRQLCRRLGAGMAVSEMVSSNAKLRRHRITLRRLDFAGEPGPVAVQIVGSDPAAMAAAARANADIGADIIDINMGCPAKKVCKVDAGSALLRSETLVAEILAAVVAAVDIPVTLKIRTGWSRETRNGERIARIAEQEGIRALAVHGRTRACGFSGDAEYDTIRTIKQSVRLPVIANGDIDCPEKALLVLRSTGADALMIGRAAQGRPWIFREIAHYLETGKLLLPPAPEQVGELLCEHLQNLYGFYGREQGVRIARKHIAWYGKCHPESASFIQTIITTDSADQQLLLIKKFFVQPGTERGMAA
ncbi:MAG: tRNA dihydrouridine synthase DusB [Chromatiaceae bacterium]|nr:tRNA dihydrouridine synthase DusB [Chromatiaceae bacterium]